MTYTKLNLKNGDALTAEHISHIEDGILKTSSVCPGKGIIIDGKTIANNEIIKDDVLYGGLLHYLLNTNANLDGTLNTSNGRVTIGEYYPTNGKPITVSYESEHFTGIAIRYVNKDRTQSVTADESAYARIVLYNTNISNATADMVDETTIVINGNGYALMAGLYEDYVNWDPETDAPIVDEDNTEPEPEGVIIEINDMLVSTVNDYNINIFENIVCIGDSLTAGFTNKCGTTYGSNKARDTKRNWPGFLSYRLGKNITNLGYGSTTTHSWRYADDNLGANITLATALDTTDCFIIGLGFNDRGGKVKLGSMEDISINISDNKDTFYGNYDFIINSLLNVNEKCHVFLLTMPHPVEPTHKYNEAIREISEKFKETTKLRVHLIDLANNYNDFYKNGIIGDTFNGHAFPLTYQLISMNTQKAISEYIGSNYKHFYGTPWQ